MKQLLYTIFAATLVLGSVESGAMELLSVDQSPEMVNKPMSRFGKARSQEVLSNIPRLTVGGMISLTMGKLMQRRSDLMDNGFLVNAPAIVALALAFYGSVDRCSVWLWRGVNFSSHYTWRDRAKSLGVAGLFASTGAVSSFGLYWALFGK